MIALKAQVLLIIQQLILIYILFQIKFSVEILTPLLYSIELTIGLTARKNKTFLKLLSKLI